MSGGTDRALSLLRHQLPDGWHITDITPSSSSGSRDPDGRYAPDGGWYKRTYDDSWCVTVQPDGWESWRPQWFKWGKDIRTAALLLAWSIRKTRRNPHLVHMCLEGPGEVQREAYFLRGCPQCEDEAARLFDGKVEWTQAAA